MKHLIVVATMCLFALSPALQAADSKPCCDKEKPACCPKAQDKKGCCPADQGKCPMGKCPMSGDKKDAPAPKDKAPAKS